MTFLATELFPALEKLLPQHVRYGRPGQLPGTALEVIAVDGWVEQSDSAAAMRALPFPAHARIWLVLHADERVHQVSPAPILSRLGWTERALWLVLVGWHALLLGSKLHRVGSMM